MYKFHEKTGGVDYVYYWNLGKSWNLKKKKHDIEYTTYPSPKFTNYNTCEQDVYKR